MLVAHAQSHQAELPFLASSQDAVKHSLLGTLIITHTSPAAPSLFSSPCLSQLGLLTTQPDPTSRSCRRATSTTPTYRKATTGGRRPEDPVFFLCGLTGADLDDDCSLLQRQIRPAKGCHPFVTMTLLTSFCTVKSVLPGFMIQTPSRKCPSCHASKNSASWPAGSWGALQAAWYPIGRSGVAYRYLLYLHVHHPGFLRCCLAAAAQPDPRGRPPWGNSGVQ